MRVCLKTIQIQTIAAKLPDEYVTKSSVQGKDRCRIIEWCEDYAFSVSL